MRNILYKLSIFCLILTVFSCAKDTEYIPVDEGTTAFKATVKGQTVEFKNATKAIYNILDKKTIEITAYGSGEKIINFTIDDFKGIGSYDITETMLTTLGYVGNLQDFDTYYTSTSGKITITTYNDKLIVGKFEAIVNNGSEDVNITKGEFSVDLSTALEHDHLGGNKFSAKLNGTLIGFKGQIIHGGSALNISGSYGTKNITLGIREFTGIGTYTFNDDQFFGNNIMYNPNANDDYLSTSGTVNITSTDNNTLKGTFNGTVKNVNGIEIVITDGNFEVKDE